MPERLLIPLIALVIEADTPQRSVTKRGVAAKSTTPLDEAPKGAIKGGNALFKSYIVKILSRKKEFLKHFLFYFDKIIYIFVIVLQYKLFKFFVLPVFVD